MATASTSGFRLSSGGLLPRLRIRLKGPESRPLAVADEIGLLAAITWLPLLIASTIEGTVTAGVDIPFLLDPGPWARFLGALPLLIGIRGVIDRSLDAVLDYLQTSGVVPESSQDALASGIRELERRRDSTRGDVVILLLAVALSLAAALAQPWLGPEGQITTWMKHADGALSATAWIYFGVSLPVLFVLLLRWLWRLVAWMGFLYRISRLPLNVEASHPDRCGGLAVLSIGQFAFALVFAAVSTVASSSLARELIYSSLTFQQAMFRAFQFTLFFVALLVAPLLLFAGKMIVAKKWALIGYGGLGIATTRAFRDRWLGLQTPDSGPEFLEANAPSAHTDYNSVYATMRSMRWIPIGLRGVAALALLVFVPFFPLIFTELSPILLLQRLIRSLF